MVLNRVGENVVLLFHDLGDGLVQIGDGRRRGRLRDRRVAMEYRAREENYPRPN